jgi:hypothetical protein
MPDVSNEDWVLAYQAAFRAANPHHEQPVRVSHWTGGWYRIAQPGQPVGDRKYTRRQIEGFTERLLARVAKAEQENQK